MLLVPSLFSSRHSLPLPLSFTFFCYFLLIDFIYFMLHVIAEPASKAFRILAKRSNVCITKTNDDYHPSPYLMCYAILSTSFGDKGPHLRRWQVAQSSDGLLAEVFRGFRRVNARRSVYSSRFRLIIINRQTSLTWLSGRVALG